VAIKADRPRRGLDQPQNKSSECALARSGLTHKPECFPGMDVERDILDCPNLSLSPRQGRLARDKNLGQISNFNQGHDWILALSRQRQGVRVRRLQNVITCKRGMTY